MPYSIVLTLLGIEKLVSPEHPANAPSPMKETVLGVDIVSTLMQLPNILNIDNQIVIR